MGVMRMDCRRSNEGAFTGGCTEDAMPRVCNEDGLKEDAIRMHFMESVMRMDSRRVF
jgi:hypothetical protein